MRRSFAIQFLKRFTHKVIIEIDIEIISNWCCLHLYLFELGEKLRGLGSNNFNISGHAYNFQLTSKTETRFVDIGMLRAETDLERKVVFYLKG